jgi:arabinogalactan oligomer/maltooligosaccharide transport system substrate-binding protein
MKTLVKFLLSLICIFILAFALVGCKSPDPDNTPDEIVGDSTTPDEIVGDSTTPDGDLPGGKEEENPSVETHNWESFSYFAPTCVRPGSQTHRCTECGEFKNEAIAPTGIHTPGEEYFASAEEHWLECTVCNERLSIEAHSFVNELCEPCHTYETYYEVSLWVQSGYMNKNMFAEKVAEFAEANRITIKLTLTQKDASVGGNDIMADPASSPDIFCFTQKELEGMVDAGAIAPITGSNEETVRLTNSAASVRLAEYGDRLYGYPLQITSRTCVMYYDKSLISEEDAKSLERIIEICEANGRTFHLQTSSGWGVEHFFMSTGCNSVWTMSKGWEFIGLNDNYNSREGIVAMKGLKKLISSPCFSDETYYLGERTAVLISELGSRWSAENALGDNLGVTVLPSFTVDGESYQMGSYISTVMFGVKPTDDTERARMLSDLALYISGEDVQTRQLLEYGCCPTNMKVQLSDEAQQDKYLAAQIRQSHSSTPELHRDLYWYIIAGDIYYDLLTATEDDYAAILARYDERVSLLFEKGEYS